MSDPWPLEELARRIWEERKQIVQIGRESDLPYYMLNIRQPSVAALYRRWRIEKREISFPPGDLERLMWELHFFNQRALDELQKHFEMQDSIKKLREKGDQ